MIKPFVYVELDRQIIQILLLLNIHLEITIEA